MKKGKSRIRRARINIVRRDAARTRREAGRSYDSRQYDKPASEEQ
jgi:hypothetical protein